MATINAEQARKDVITPSKGRFYIRHIWVLDEQTKRPVRVRKVYIFS